MIEQLLQDMGATEQQAKELTQAPILEVVKFFGEVDMNKHKAYWSTMGLEPTENENRKDDFARFEKALKIMIGKYGKTETLSLVRQILEQEG